jgi:uncharacterized protein YndB with AHSA1/START domain
MDHYATLARPVATVFAGLAAPARLCDWVCEVERVETDPAEVTGVGTPMTVTVLEGDTARIVDGEVIGYEPPWLIAYRIFLTQPRVLRLTCTASDGGTRVHVHQSDHPAPLTVDLTHLVDAGLGPAPP